MARSSWSPYLERFLLLTVALVTMGSAAWSQDWLPIESAHISGTGTLTLGPGGDLNYVSPGNGLTVWQAARGVERPLGIGRRWQGKIYWDGDDSLYYFEKGGVLGGHKLHRYRISTGNETTLHGDLLYPQAGAANADAVYFCNQENIGARAPVIYRIPPDGGELEELWRGPGGVVRDMCLDGDGFLFILHDDEGDQTLYRWDPKWDFKAGFPETLLEGLSGCSGIAPDRWGNLYFAQGTERTVLSRWLRDEGTVETIFDDPRLHGQAVTDLAVMPDGDAAYLAVSGLPRPGQRSVVRVAFAGPRQQVVEVEEDRQAEEPPQLLSAVTSDVRIPIELDPIAFQAPQQGMHLVHADPGRVDLRLKESTGDYARITAEGGIQIASTRPLDSLEQVEALNNDLARIVDLIKSTVPAMDTEEEIAAKRVRPRFFGDPPGRFHRLVLRYIMETMGDFEWKLHVPECNVREARSLTYREGAVFMLDGRTIAVTWASGPGREVDIADLLGPGAHSLIAHINLAGNAYALLEIVTEPTEGRFYVSGARSENCIIRANESMQVFLGEQEPETERVAVRSAVVSDLPEPAALDPVRALAEDHGLVAELGQDGHLRLDFAHSTKDVAIITQGGNLLVASARPLSSLDHADTLQAELNLLVDLVARTVEDADEQTKWAAKYARARFFSDQPGTFHRITIWALPNLQWTVSIPRCRVQAARASTLSGAGWIKFRDQVVAGGGLFHLGDKKDFTEHAIYGRHALSAEGLFMVFWATLDFLTTPAEGPFELEGDKTDEHAALVSCEDIARCPGLDLLGRAPEP